MNKQKFYKVSADTEISVLKALLREGRLYASSSSEELAISEAIRMLRNIHSVVSPEYEANIGKILKAIFSIPTIKKRMLYKKGKVAGTTNSVSTLWLRQKWRNTITRLSRHSIRLALPRKKRLLSGIMQPR